MHAPALHRDGHRLYPCLFVRLLSSLAPLPTAKFKRIAIRFQVGRAVLIVSEMPTGLKVTDIACVIGIRRIETHADMLDS